MILAIIIRQQGFTKTLLTNLDFYKISIYFLTAIEAKWFEETRTMAEILLIVKVYRIFLSQLGAKN
jgi:hypothetical protein